MTKFASLLCGLLFGAGLAASGMTNTAKVIGFLDIFGNWDPDLLFVMGAAVVSTVVAFPLVLKRAHPIFAEKFSVPTNTVIDSKLLGGAAIFGVGWGLYGYCPGPAISAMVYLQPATFVFIIAMVIGMAVSDRLLRS